MITNFKNITNRNSLVTRMFRLIITFAILTTFFSALPMKANAYDKNIVIKRTEAAKQISNAFYQEYNFAPIITFGNKDKSILIIESVRLNSHFIGLIMAGIEEESHFFVNVHKLIMDADFKKVMFIRQRYNVKEFDGWIWNTEFTCLEQSDSMGLRCEDQGVFCNKNGECKKSTENRSWPTTVIK